MADLDAFISAMRNTATDLGDEFGNIVLEGAINAKSSVQNRIQEQGKGSDEVPFRDYAESTKRIRQSKGRQTIFVDLTDTGRMWANIGVINLETNEDSAVALIGGKNEFTRQKLRENTERFGPVMDLTISEEQDVVDVIDFGIQRVLNKNFPS